MTTARRRSSREPLAIPGIVVARPEPGARLLPVLVLDAPPSVRLVYLCLWMEAARTSRELRDCTGLPERTVRHAIKWMIEQGIARRQTTLQDARQDYILLNREAPEVPPTVPHAAPHAVPHAALHPQEAVDAVA